MDKAQEIRSRIAEIDYIILKLQERRKRLSDSLSKFAQESLPLPEDPAQKKEEYSEVFERHWKFYVEKTGRNADKRKAFTAHKKINAREYQAIVRAISNYGASRTVKDGYARDFHRFLRDDFWPTWVNKIPTPEDKFTVQKDAREIVKGVFKK